MNKYKTLNIKGAILDKNQLEKYLENLAAEHNCKKKSDSKTFPIHVLKENFNMITETYKLLTKQLKQGITLHAAGEWILDNYYIIEESVKSVEKELNLKKYKNFVQITNENFKGFARVYVLASEIVGYTDCKIDAELIKNSLMAYQRKKLLSMEELWNINTFLKIAIIQNIREYM